MARVGEDLSRPPVRPALEDPRTLSDQDLVAALMGPSTFAEERPRQTVARDLLEQAGGLRGLAADFHSVCAQADVDGESFFPVLAAFEMARRLAKANMPRRKPMDHPAAVASYLSLCYGLPDQEIMGALFLDIRNRLISEAEIFRGTLSRASVEPRTILKKALLCGASGLVLFHSHPSHDPTPSREDVLFTKRMVDAGSLLGIWIVDHLIVGVQGRWVSLAREGAL